MNIFVEPADPEVAARKILEIAYSLAGSPSRSLTGNVDENGASAAEWSAGTSSWPKGRL
jgi:hypothetical protein